MHTTYQILLLQGFSMYKSMFSFNMADVLCMEQIHKSICACICHYGNIQQSEQIPHWDVVSYIQYLCLWVSAKDLGSTLH